MTTTINADDGVVSGSAGLKYSSDSSGVLALQTNGTTAVSISTGQVVTLTNPIGGGTTVQVFTSGSGTYTTPANCKSIWVRMVGGGGGGGGSGSASGGTGGAGGNTTFGTSLLTCTGGSGGPFGSAGGAGGAATITGPNGFTLDGNAGGGITYLELSAVQLPGALGGISPFGGPGIGRGNAGGVAASGYGSGGSGGGTSQTATHVTGTGGGSGGYLEAVITTVLSTYSYAVGAGGTAGTAGTAGYVGGAGKAGIIIVTEYYV
jgi:hypothetical protein